MKQTHHYGVYEGPYYFSHFLHNSLGNKSCVELHLLWSLWAENLSWEIPFFNISNSFSNCDLWDYDFPRSKLGISEYEYFRSHIIDSTTSIMGRRDGSVMPPSPCSSLVGQVCRLHWDWPYLFRTVPESKAWQSPLKSWTSKGPNYYKSLPALSLFLSSCSENHLDQDQW